MIDESGDAASSPASELQLLQALVVDNPELEELESLLEEFNIFEALGAVRQEARHSDFLAFLLNPRQNHGLGDAFARRLLQKAIARRSVPPPSPPSTWICGT